MPIRRSKSPFAAAQILERRRMLSAVMESRELAGLFGADRTIEESIIARPNNSTSSSGTDSRTRPSKSNDLKFDSTRVITPREGSFGSNGTMSKGPEGGVVNVTGTALPDNIVISTDGTNIIVDVNGTTSTFADASFDSIIIDGLGGGDSIYLESNSNNPTTLRGGAGEDLIALTPTGGNLDPITASVLVDGGDEGAWLELYDDVNGFADPYTITNNAVTRDFFGGVSFGSVTQLLLNGQSVGSVFNVQSSPACPVTVLGNGGDDVCRITESIGNLEDLGGAFKFDGGTENDQIQLFDTSNEFDDAFTMNVNAISRPFVDPITCIAEDIYVAMGLGNNQFTLTDFDQPHIGMNGFDGNDTLIVNGLATDSVVDFAGNAGINAVAVERTSIGSEVSFLAGGEGDSLSIGYSFGDLSNVAGAVVINSLGTNPSVTLWDDLNDAQRFYVIDQSTVTRSGGFGGLTYSDTGAITLNATTGQNQINVNATAAGTSYEIFGNNGDDSVIFTESSGTLANLASTVNFVGGAGGDALHFFDYFRTDSSTYTFTSTQLSGAGFATQTFSEVEAATLYAGDGENEITVSNTDAIEQAVLGGDGADIIHVSNTVTPVRISGGDGLDEFFIGVPPNLNFAGTTAQAEALGESVDQLAQLRVGFGSKLSIANQHTLACAIEDIVGTLSFGQRSSYIAVANSNPLPLLGALSYIANGYNSGAWNGTSGSFSSDYSATSTAGDGIGYARASDLGVTTFDGFGVAANDMIFTQTRYGDANLDHTVNFNDLLKLAQNYNGTSKFWFHGDFDYNQGVNFADLLRTAQNYGQSAIFGDRRIGSVVDSVLRDSREV